MSTDSLSRAWIWIGLVLITLAVTSSVSATQSTPIRAGSDATLELLEQLAKEIKTLHQELDQRFDSKAAPKTLDAAFDQASVVWSRRYLPTWGNEIWVDWEVGQKLHNDLVHYLRDHASAIRNGNREETTSLAYLNHLARMNHFRKANKLMTELFEKRLMTLGKRGQQLDAWEASRFKDKGAHSMADDWESRSNIASKMIRELGNADLLEPGIAERFEAIKDTLEQLAVENPSAGVFLAAAKLRHATADAYREATELLQWLGTQENEIDRDQAARRLAGLITALAKAHREGADDPSLLYQLAKVVGRLNRLGLAHNDYLMYAEGQDGLAAFKAIKRGTDYMRAFESVRELLEKREISQRQLLNDTLAPVPKKYLPGIKGPAGAAFEDLQTFNENGFGHLIAGVDLVADAIETGDVDRERLADQEAQLKQWAETGPWTEGTGKKMARKSLEGIPIIGNILQFIW